MSAALVSSLSGDRPIALLPIRLETMFAEHATVLRIRIYPDALHVHTFEPELTQLEIDASRQYWERRWHDDDPAEAWKSLIARYRPPRAAWIAEALTPTNIGELGAAAAPTFPSVDTKDSPWTKPPRASALPDHWMAFGYRDGEQLFFKSGAPIPDDLAVGLAPDVDEQPDADTVETQHVPDADQPELTIDDGMRWMVDYDEALAVGMAITVEPSDVGPDRDLRAGLDRLVVIGVTGRHHADGSIEPSDGTEGAVEIGSLLDHHRHTEGLELLRLGTPTNNTSTVASAYDGTERDLASALDPARPVPDVSANAGGRRVAVALGLDKDRLDRTMGAERTEDSDAAHMNRLLWPATLGYCLDTFFDPLVSDHDADAVRGHFVDHVRGRGPLPPLRVGDQPFGILPVVARDRYVPSRGDDTAAAIHTVLQRARGFWRHCAEERSPVLGRRAQPGSDLLDVLESTPNSVSLRIRNVFGPVVMSNVDGFQALFEAQEAMGQWVSRLVMPEARSSLVDRIVHRPRHRILDVPFVQGEPALSETEPLDVNYLAEIAEVLGQAGDFAALRAGSARTRTLLDALARHAAVLEVLRATQELIAAHRVESGEIKSRPTKILPREPELVESVPLETKGEMGIATLLGSALQPFAPLTGTTSLVDHVLDPDTLASHPELADLRDFIVSVTELASVPTAALERLVAESLDLCSYRLDAWHTSLATARLAELRTAAPTGLHVGGFGWVEDLHPSQRPDSLGYVHTPSLGQAATTAVLRSGHLAHRHRDTETLAIDLTSDRVRRALTVLDGVRAGQSLGALLGYRFERAIRERSSAMSQYVIPLRRLTPSPVVVGDDTATPLESSAARDVVDGLELLELWRKIGEKMFLLTEGLPLVGGHKELMVAELDALDDLVDAISDVLLAEAVHQSAAGNTDRAAAAMDAFDRQGPPPEPEFLRTPRTGTGVTHRVLVTMHATDLPSSWSDAPVDPRAAADPLSNAWVARVLGRRDRFRFALDALALDSGGEATVVQTVQCRLGDLGLSPLSVVWAGATAGGGPATELEERAVHHLSGLLDDRDDIDHLELHAGVRPNWPASAVGLTDLLTLTESIRTLIAGHRPMVPADFARSVDAPDAGSASIDHADLADRAAAAAAALDDAAAALDAARGDGDVDALDPDAVRAALLGAADLGVPAAVPGDLTTTEQLDHVIAEVDNRLDARNAAADPAHVIAAVFGTGFQALPRFTPPFAAELAASRDDRAGLFDGRPLAPTSWLQQMALVRPDVAHLSEVLSTAELLGGGTDPTRLAVTQRPHRLGDRWVAGALDGTKLPAADVGFVVHDAAGFDPTANQSGVVVDEWFELIPNPVETTGVSFHYDAPGARAPQSVLLAVPPERDAATWNLEWLLDTVHEAIDLSKIRAVDPQRIWFANRYLPAAYLASNVRDHTASVNMYQVDRRARTGVVADRDDVERGAVQPDGIADREGGG